MRVDIDKIKNLLKEDCVTCNRSEKRINGSMCKDCPFYSGKLNSLFKSFGIERRLEKHHVYFFIYHPELNWELPKIPEKDLLGNKKEDKKLRWDFHHINRNHFDDRKENILLCLNSEHTYYHDKIYNPMSNPEVVRKAAIGIKKARAKEIENGTHNFITNHPMKNPEIAKKCGETRKRRHINGQYSYRTKQEINILKWLTNIEPGRYIINNELIVYLGYSTKGEPKYVKNKIEKIIKIDNVKNCEVEHNGGMSSNSKWFLIKREEI